MPEDTTNAPLTPVLPEASPANAGAGATAGLSIGSESSAAVAGTDLSTAPTNAVNQGSAADPATISATTNPNTAGGAGEIVDPKLTTAGVTNAAVLAGAEIGSTLADTDAKNAQPDTTPIDTSAAIEPETALQKFRDIAARISVDVRLKTLEDIDYAILALSKRAVELNTNLSSEINEIKAAHNLV